MKRIAHFLFLIVLLACSKDDGTQLDVEILSDYLALNIDRTTKELIACAGGKADGLQDGDNFATSIFYYPVENATNVQYFEALDIADSLDFSRYKLKALESEPVFNGYLRKFSDEFEGERMAIVTYQTPGNIHVSDPIRLKTNLKPTEVNATLGTVTENGTAPSFSWQDGQIDENVIYFQVISDSDNNLISGTYTFEKHFRFYDLENVVLNISLDSPTPSIQPDNTYTFTLMGISEDNWVNLFFQKEFRTNM